MFAYSFVANMKFSSAVVAAATFFGSGSASFKFGSATTLDVTFSWEASNVTVCDQPTYVYEAGSFPLSMDKVSTSEHAREHLSTSRRLATRILARLAPAPLQYCTLSLTCTHRSLKLAGITRRINRR